MNSTASTNMDYCTDPLTAHECETLFTDTVVPVVLSTVGAVISEIFSFVTIVMILRSPIKLSSIYHRIMFMMSAMNILSSSAILLSTLPMPRDLIYPFDGTSIGTVVSCEIQGFMNMVGTAGSFFYYCGLCLFYLCLIQIRMKDKNLKRFLEPLIHLFGLLLPLGIAFFFLYTDLINPSPYETWCTIARYPYQCEEYGIECIRGGAFKNLRSIFIIIRTIIVLVGCLHVLMCMGWIIWGARNNRLLEEDNGPAGDRSQPSWNSLKKNLVKQALLYIAGFFFVFTFPSIAIYCRENRTILILRLIFLPLQGFTNSSIFMYHKVHNIRREYPDVGIIEAMHYAISSSKEFPEIRITGLSKVTIDMTRKENRRNVVDSFDDDNGDIGSLVAASKNVHISGVSEEVSFMLGAKFSSGNFNPTTTDRENTVSSCRRSKNSNNSNNILSLQNYVKKNNISSPSSNRNVVVSSGNLMSIEISSNFFSSNIPEELSYEEESSNNDVGLSYQRNQSHIISSSISKTSADTGGTGSKSNKSNKTYPTSNKPTKLPTKSANF